MAVFYFPNRTSPTATLTLSKLEAYPSARPLQKLQSRDMTPGGAPVVYDLGVTLEYVNIVIQLINDIDKASLLSFIQNTVSWSVDSFDLTDDRGVQYNTCRFWLDALQFSLESFEYSSVEILILVGG